MKLKLISAVPAALLLVFALSGCGRNDDRLVMVTEATFPPYEFREGGKIVGIDVDLMKAVAKKTGRELVVEDMSFDSVIAAVQAGKADVAASGITVTDERKRQVGFSHPYVTAQQVVIVPKDSEIRGSADLKGKRIGVQHGTTGDLYVTRNIREPERFPNGSLAVAALDAGKLDAVVLDGEPSKVHVALHENLVILDEPLTTEEYAIAVNRKNTALLEEINAVIDELRENGGLEKIKAKYVKQ
ncbi:basic amino acid ABC transporter substrate-binding protein [Victivallis lenta]|uniref:basic amino acid ABC transporter substrate-binding protein n=1 Tax=Victivallis lenta TaxID=2606640 RepID=UPI000D04420C|nr:basic amino acid ABC transporter substrate-binding protein [Victivallis lenta]AVM43287.1 ABC transporter substrate-binding protein [Victivallales bacterium CCUG 44730]